MKISFLSKDRFVKASTILLMTMTLFFSPFLSKVSADSWDTALSNLDRLHDSFTTLEAVVKLEKGQTETVHKKNSSKLTTVNEKIKLIDKTKLDQLKASADQASNKYAPLLAEYTELGKQAAAARQNKNQKSADLYDLKRNKLKPSVDAAHLEIKNKKDALSLAKKQTADKAKVVRDALVPVQTLKQQITNENTVVTMANKNRSAAEKLYKAAIKQGNAVTAAAEMTNMYTELGRVHASQQKIKSWEDKIASTLITAESKL